ncbi:DUF2569 domain-containing protein [Sphingomonas ginkgonis]|uniref:DUF2569 domain-containing protein n=1 Tax=Sphingomonas ginkgonis TaxID=2315330 RepID=A0A3R9Y410_9SPHN|nr:DUF2569 domain-containing protein [Sphingomonas ginkgonis]RST29701.1 DUF2569 domain-containing protein [Sphingomonas ginkgonis]
MLVQLRQRLQVRSTAMLATIEGGLDRLVIGWLLLAGLACALRLATSPIPHGLVPPSSISPYLLLTVMPAASMLLALRWFRDGDRLEQPAFRLARVGRWTALSRTEARRHPLYGPSGVMVSLLVGMLLNVPVRALEFLAASPALTEPVPGWLSTLHFLMSLDAVLLTSLYAVAFVAALRGVPLFPRLLVAVWCVDLAMQLVVADGVMASGRVPADVAAALQGLLEGNIKKVLISAALWLPYLLLSRRVNVTYRHRVLA